MRRQYSKTALNVIFLILFWRVYMFLIIANADKPVYICAHIKVTTVSYLSFNLVFYQQIDHF